MPRPLSSAKTTTGCGALTSCSAPSACPTPSGWLRADSPPATCVAPRGVSRSLATLLSAVRPGKYAIPHCESAVLAPAEMLKPHPQLPDLPLGSAVRPGDSKCVAFRRCSHKYVNAVAPSSVGMGPVKRLFQRFLRGNPHRSPTPQQLKVAFFCTSSRVSNLAPSDDSLS